MFFWVQIVAAMPVNIHAVESNVPARVGHGLDTAVNGSLTPENGWSTQEGQSRIQYAVFATDKPLDATMFQFQFNFLGQEKYSYFGKFEISVTADEKPGLKGRWMPLLPDTVAADIRDGARSSGVVIYIKTNCSISTLMVQAKAPFEGITGFRLKLLPVLPDSGGTNPPFFGCSTNGDFMLTKLSLEASPSRSSNIALGRQVFVFGRAASPSGYPPKNITDGFYSTYSRPDINWNGKPFYFELDFGREITLDHIVVRGCQDGRADDALSDYQVELGTKSGDTPLNILWHGQFHINGSSPTPDNTDFIHASDGMGTFSGSILRICKVGGSARQPEIAELEVYPALKAQAQNWLADGKVLAEGEKIAVPAGIHQLGFTIVSEAPDVPPNVVVYRWRIPGYRDSWQETGTDGQVLLSPPPRPGKYTLFLQAQHSDCLWDQSGQTVAMQIAVPWWENPGTLSMIFAGIAVVAAAIWWRLYILMIQRRLKLTEQNLELNQERLRIARDMHDEVGARLTYIALLADRINNEKNGVNPETDAHLKLLAENSRSAVESLDTIVWAVNPEHDTIGDLGDFLCDYALEYLKVANIQCHLTVKIESPHSHIGLAVRQEFLMAVKEALQNVVKHSGAKNVYFSFQEINGVINAFIKDDGHGFNGQPDKISHHGLDNMENRLSRIGGACNIDQQGEGGGTRVSFTFALK
jgi:signal transduction histidine kinase